MPYLLRPTVTQTFLARVRATPEAIGFQYRKQGELWRKVSFRSFFEEARLLSLGLIHSGIKPQDRVALICRTRFEWPLIDMAILGAKAVTVPIYPSSSLSEMVYILGQSGAVVAFVETQAQLEALLTKKAELPNLKTLILIEGDLAHKDEATRIFHDLKEQGRGLLSQEPNLFERNLDSALPGDLISVCYTSGTTGTPKGVKINHDNMMSVIEDCILLFGSKLRPESESLAAFLPFSHILGKLESMSTYAFGWKECFISNYDELALELQTIRPTLLFCVPRIFEKGLQAILSEAEKLPVTQKALFQEAMDLARKKLKLKFQGKKLPLPQALRLFVLDRVVLSQLRSKFGGKLKFAISGGAPLSRETGEALHSIGIPILEGYGLTETSAPVTVNTLESLKYGTVGRPLPEVQIKTANNGEIWVKSRKVFSGYFEQPEETAQVLSDGWLKTGDVGHFDSEGFLVITDRIKDLIVTSGGKNIAPQKIENLAKDQRVLNQVYVYGDQKPFLTALITLNRSEIINYARENQLLYSEYTELLRHPKVVALAQKAVDGLNQNLASFESIQKFVVLPEDFTVESGDLTPSLKLRRKWISNRYQNELERLYR